MSTNYYALIMAGGVGSRFWPVSTQNFPKQFHDMLGTGQSLIQRTFERINMLVPTENILIATNKKYEKLVLKQLAKVKANQLLLEPAMRNTAPCILYAALKIHQKSPDGVMLVAPSDHWIIDEFEFLRNIKSSFEACLEDDILMTLGIQPDHPNTGYGYIQFDNNTNSEAIKQVKNFTEKPNLEKAKTFLNSGDYLWNAGIFVWPVKSILKAFKEYLPEMYTILKNDIVYNTAEETDFINVNYEKCQDISIDFGIMEQAKNVKVLPVNFGWSDLGTWGSLYKKLKKDHHKNAIVGARTIFRNASGNMIRTQNGKRVVIQGLNNYIVIENQDVLLICPQDDEQEIKEIRNEVKNTFGKKFI